MVTTKWTWRVQKESFINTMHKYDEYILSIQEVTNSFFRIRDLRRIFKNIFGTKNDQKVAAVFKI